MLEKDRPSGICKRHCVRPDQFLSGSLIVALFTHLSFSVFCYYFVPVTSRGFLLNTGGPYPVKRRGKNLEILCPPQPTVACGQCASAGGLKPSWVSSGVNTKQHERSGCVWDFTRHRALLSFCPSPCCCCSLIVLLWGLRLKKLLGLKSSAQGSLLGELDQRQHTFLFLC